MLKSLETPGLTRELLAVGTKGHNVIFSQAEKQESRPAVEGEFGSCPFSEVTMLTKWRNGEEQKLGFCVFFV